MSNKEINANNINDYLNMVANKTLEDVTDKALDCLQQHIILGVYRYDYYPNKSYASKYGDPSGRRGLSGTPASTFQFYDAFQLDNIKKELNHYVRDLIYNSSSMIYDPFYGIHGDYNKGDLRDDLFNLLNVNGIFAHKERLAYWDNFIDEFTHKIKDWITKSLNNQGIYNFIIS